MKPQSSSWFTPACSVAIAYMRHFYQLFERDSPDPDASECKPIFNEAMTQFAYRMKHGITPHKFGSRDYRRQCKSILNKSKSQPHLQSV